MRTSPYPVPPSRVWSVTMAATYVALALAGGIVLAAFVILPQSVEGAVVLGLWGGCSLAGGLAGLSGVARSRYRQEWFGAWLIVLGTSVYLVITMLGLVGATALLLIGATMLVVLLTLWRILDGRRPVLWGVAGAVAAMPLAYLAAASVGDGWMILFQSAPTILVFVYAIGTTLGRAIQLSLIDYAARRTVRAQRTATGEIPEVSG